MSYSKHPGSAAYRCYHETHDGSHAGFACLAGRYNTPAGGQQLMRASPNGNTWDSIAIDASPPPDQMILS